MTASTAEPESTTRAGTDALVSMRRVNKYFGDLHVLADIDLDITRG